MALGRTMLFACGLPWLAQFVGWDNVIATGLLPFLPGDVFKQVLAALALPAAWSRGPPAGWTREGF